MVSGPFWLEDYWVGGSSVGSWVLRNAVFQRAVFQRAVFQSAVFQSAAIREAGHLSAACDGRQDRDRVPVSHLGVELVEVADVVVVQVDVDEPVERTIVV